MEDFGGLSWDGCRALPTLVRCWRQPLSSCVSLTLSLFHSLTPLQMETVKQGVDQKLVEGQERLHQMWLNWNQKQLQGTEQTPAKPEVPAWGDTRGAWGPDMPLHASLPDGPTCPEYFPQPLLLLTAFRTQQHLLQEARLDVLSWVWVLPLDCGTLDCAASQPAQILSHISSTFSSIPASWRPSYSPAWLLGTIPPQHPLVPRICPGHWSPALL